MAAAATSTSTSASATTSTSAPADVVDRLHTKVTELCEAYFTSIGHLQSVAPRLAPGANAAAEAAVCAEPAATFAADVQRLHGEFDTLVGELESEHRTEREQLDSMAALQESARRNICWRLAPVLSRCPLLAQVEMDRANDDIREMTATAKKLRHQVRQAVNSRLGAEWRAPQ